LPDHESRDSSLSSIPRRTVGALLRRVPGNLYGGLIFLILESVSRFPSHTFRLFAYRSFGMTVGPSAHIYRGLEVREPHQVSIGANTIVGHNVILDGRGILSIGENVNLSSQTAIWTMTHDPQSSTFAATTGQVSIGRDAWLGFRATVLPGISIGEGAVVASGSVVTKDVAPFAIVAGVPARQVGTRSCEIAYELGASSQLAFV
jgi:acetyltransferase-like isoleucine patch superfamily enzyme